MCHNFATILMWQIVNSREKVVSCESNRQFIIFWHIKYIYSCGKLCGKDCNPKITYRNISFQSKQMYSLLYSLHMLPTRHITCSFKLISWLHLVNFSLPSKSLHADDFELHCRKVSCNQTTNWGKPKKKSETQETL